MYHSSFVSEDGIAKACGCPLLPLKNHIKGLTPVSDQGFFLYSHLITVSIVPFTCFEEFDAFICRSN